MEPAPGLHVGIVMDGNGRWAERRGLPRRAGHRAGAETVGRIVSAATALGIDTLTLYAFSSDNWRRPADEVSGLMRLFTRHLTRESHRCVEQKITLEVVGRRDRLPAPLLRAIEEAEHRTRDGAALRLRIALDYSGRDAIRRAALAMAAQSVHDITPVGFAELVSSVDHGGPVQPADIIIRTGGERRLSDFLLWESAYAELFFLDTPWPEFNKRELAAVISAFRRRERRFGGVGVTVINDVRAASLSSGS